jgi:hypothetical protein
LISNISLVETNLNSLIDRLYDEGENSINYNDLIFECKLENINLNETSVKAIEYLHEVIIEDKMNENVKHPVKDYFDRFIDHVILRFLERFQPIFRTIFEYENEINMKKMVYFTKDYLKKENEILLEQDKNILSKIDSRREKLSEDDSMNKILNEKFFILKSFILCCFDQDLNSIYYLSKLFLIDKIKFASFYEFAKKIFDSKEEISKNEESKINFFLLFSDYNSCIEICIQHSENQQFNELKISLEYVLLLEQNLTPISVPFENQESNKCNRSNQDKKDSEEESDEDKKKSNDPSKNESQDEGPKTADNNNKKYFILSIDGGGIKGIVPLYFLRDLEIRLNKKVYEIFDMFAGTSIGGLIALILSQKKYSAESLLKKMFGSYKNEIFKWSTPHFLSNRKFYDANNLENLLQRELEDLTLKNSQGNFFITSNYRISIMSLQPCVFVRYNNDNKVVFGLIDIVDQNDLTFIPQEGFDGGFLTVDLQIIIPPNWYMNT